MSYTPITGSALQYMADSVSANNHYVKFYASGTTTPISMATDSTGGTLLSKAQFDAQGYAINGSSAPFIPHIDQKYKIVFYPNATDADANTFANAVFEIDLIDQFAVIVTGTEFAKNFATLAAAIADTTLVEDQIVHVINDHFYKVILAAGYTIIADVDFLMDNGLVLKRSSDATLTTGRDSYTTATTGTLASLTDGKHVKNRRVTGTGSHGYYVTGEDISIKNVEFAGTGSVPIGECIYVREGAEAPIFSENYFEDTGYQIIQLTGNACHGVRAIANTTKDCRADFFLQNNDTQNGLTHSWIAALNYVDATNSVVSYGATESRGISFTSCYGGINIANALVGIKGDAATHLENIQETVHGFNYYRNCYKDILFSGLTTRKLIQINTILGGDGVAVGDVLNGATSGASGTIFFWFADSQIAQVINITGAFQNTENYTITAKDTNGALQYVDPVQTHANVIGNVFHKTTVDGKTSTHLGANNYHLRNHLIGNSYNCQTARGAAMVAVNCVFAFYTDHSQSSYRGWDTAFDGGSSVNLVNIRESYFWNNIKNINATTWDRSRIEGNTFFDGAITFGTMTETKLRNNIWYDGEIDIVGSGTGNEWRDNIVDPAVTITNLDPIKFNVWESKTYSRKDSTHSIRSSTAISSGSLTKELIATLKPLGANTSAVIEWKLTSRSATSGGRRYADMGRALLEWDNASAAIVTNDAANFVSGTKTIGVTLDISGTDIQVNFDYTATGFSSQASVEINIVTDGSTVTPVKFLDVE